MRVTYKDYVAGWQDSTIHDFLHEFSCASTTRFALITCLDSNRNAVSLRETSPELSSIADRLSPLGKGLVVSTQLLLDLEARQQVFFGFDEVWFFPTKPHLALPDSASIVGPTRLDKSRLAGVGQWMEDTSCSMGLGGGDGLNFIVKARGLARYFVGSSIEQTQTTIDAARFSESSRTVGAERG